MSELTRAEVLIFAALRAYCAGLKPKQRVAFLRDFAAVLSAWEAEPVNFKDRELQAMRVEAAAVFRAMLPRLVA